MDIESYMFTAHKTYNKNDLMHCCFITFEFCFPQTSILTYICVSVLFIFVATFLCLVFFVLNYLIYACLFITWLQLNIFTTNSFFIFFFSSLFISFFLLTHIACTSFHICFSCSSSAFDILKTIITIMIIVEYCHQ